MEAMLSAIVGFAIFVGIIAGVAKLIQRFTPLTMIEAAFLATVAVFALSFGVGYLLSFL
jgi:hypothetical protein